MAGSFARFVWTVCQPCPRCMCSYGTLTLKTANMRFMSNGHRLMNIQERQLPKKKWKLRTLALAFGSSTVAYVIYHHAQNQHFDTKVKNLEGRLIIMGLKDNFFDMFASFKQKQGILYIVNCKKPNQGEYLSSVFDVPALKHHPAQQEIILRTADGYFGELGLC